MTQYLISVHGGEDNAYADEEEMQRAFAQVDAFNQQLKASGSWVFAGGLTAPSDATVVDATGGEVMVTDGPYAEAKEQMGGFWIVEAADLEAALSIARQGSAACLAPVEVRPFQDEPPAE